ncbi:MAG: type II toxin-antitoxin system prevent-host-death family antitoxin [Patescibacteria group bacterium]
MKTKNIIGLKVLRENMNDYISQVEKGESFLIMKKSKPAFKITPVDEWGDEGHWKTLIDFTKIRKNGVPAREVLTAIKELNEEEDKKISQKVRKEKAK